MPKFIKENETEFLLEKKINRTLGPIDDLEFGFGLYPLNFNIFSILSSYQLISNQFLKLIQLITMPSTPFIK